MGLEVVRLAPAQDSVRRSLPADCRKGLEMWSGHEPKRAREQAGVTHKAGRLDGWKSDRRLSRENGNRQPALVLTGGG